MFLQKLPDRPKEDLWVYRLSRFFPPDFAMDVPWHSQHQFKHSWPAQGNSSTFIRNAKVTLKMQFINPRQWTLFFIMLWKINVIELEGCQHGVLLNTALIYAGSISRSRGEKERKKKTNKKTAHKVCLTLPQGQCYLGTKVFTVALEIWQNECEWYHFSSSCNLLLVHIVA